MKNQFNFEKMKRTLAVLGAAALVFAAGTLLAQTNNQPHAEDPVQSWYNSKQMLFALYGGIVIHVYHSVCNAGGLRAIAAKFIGPKSAPILPPKV